jgi:hypothetical protein
MLEQKLQKSLVLESDSHLKKKEDNKDDEMKSVLKKS